MAVIIWCYAFGFYFGGIFVRDNVHNDVRSRNYQSGDIVSIFFGVLFGAFSLGMAAPSMKAVNEGLVAGHFALSVIDRNPKIKLDEGKP